MTPEETLLFAPRGEREIVVTRAFDAPRRLVFKAWTTPALVKRWLGVFGGWSLAVCEIDLREGGAFRYVWHGPEGASMTMRGVYREIILCERIVAVAKFEHGHPGEETSTVTFVEHARRTTVTNVVLYDSRDVRDAMLRSRMEHGIGAGYDRLAQVLKVIADESKGDSQ